MKIIEQFPAYTIREPFGNDTIPAGYNECDVIALPYESLNHGRIWHFYTFGSVAGYAIASCRCPEKALTDARANGERIWWLNQNATCIHNGPINHVVRAGHNFGDVVRFHGRQFRIVRAANHNAKLVEIAQAEGLTHG